MRYSNYFIPTLKENPSEAEVVSHVLMLRAGMIRKLAAGIYNYLPLGLRSIRKVENIVREEMNRAGAIELNMPMVVPAELWQESGRWEKYGPELRRIKDRKDGDFCLGPTHEEVVTDIVRKEVKSYRQLPLNLYQIQTKFRDEIRPRFGLMRGREFIMKDAYSFDVDTKSADISYQKMYDAYRRIFERCGLKYRAVEADTGSIGGSSSHEFMVLAESGEDAIVSCSACDYAANMEKAEAVNPPLCATPAFEEMRKVHTPSKKTIAEVSEFLGMNPDNSIKTLVYSNGSDFAMALLRGDHELNEIKFKNALGWDNAFMAEEADILRITGSPIGFLGPVGIKEKVTVIADLAVKNLINTVIGANEEDYHLCGVNPGRDFNPDSYADLRNVVANDSCPRCSGGLLEIWRGIEVGHVFKLGTKYSDALRATYLDADGKEQIIFMGCYGIGIGRTVAACIEQNHDENGIIFPIPIAPFHCIVSLVNPKDEAISAAGESIYKALLEKGVEVILDDRDERPGVKFKDADLIGIPIRITVGAKNLANGNVEVKFRKEKDSNLMSPEKSVELVHNEVLSALSGGK